MVTNLQKHAAFIKNETNKLGEERLQEIVKYRDRINYNQGKILEKYNNSHNGYYESDIGGTGGFKVVGTLIYWIRL